MNLVAEMQFSFFFLEVMTGFSEKGSQTLSDGSNFASYLANYFFCHYIYSLCPKQGLG
jgi:hypothetical protein